MNRKQLVVALMAAWGAIGLVGCGGGGGSTQTGQTTSGVVTGFGSVYINGVEYDVAGGVSLDGVAGSEGSLQVGMVVTGNCTLNPGGTTGTCSSLSYADVVEGYVLSENISNGTGTLNVMGMSINVDANTLFESNDPAVASIDAIPANAIVEVSGYSDGNGNVYATRIEIKDPSASHDLELKGVVSSLAAATFTIGSLVVDYSGASAVPTGLADGLYVEVKFASAPVCSAGICTLAATSVEVEDDGDISIDGSEGDDLEQEGVVNAVAQDGSSITVNGQLMGITANSQFHDNTSLADYPVGTYVEVEAEFVNGAWVVKEIQVEDSHSGTHQEVTGLIEAAVVGMDGTSVTSITVGSAVYGIDNNTVMHDSSSSHAHFGPSNAASRLTVGACVEVRHAAGMAARISLENAAVCTGAPI
jgi:hypothetical protein